MNRDEAIGRLIRALVNLSPAQIRAVADYAFHLCEADLIEKAAQLKAEREATR
jgi:hypothetical protein